jgi:zinc transport system substrate-binding protein
MFIKYRFKFLLLLVLMFSASFSVFANPQKASSESSDLNIIVTVKPLQLIAKAVLGSLGTPELLIPPGTSPHDFQLKPSQVKKLSSAKLLIWVGPELESYLQPIIAKTGISNIALLGEAENRTTDPHLWLSPKAADDIAQKIGQRIIQMHPEYQSTIKKNIALFKKQTFKTVEEISLGLKAQALKPSIITFHNAYAYFTDYFNIPVKDIVTLSPERLPGARHLANIHMLLKKTPHGCLLVEPEFHPPYIKNLIADTQTRVYEIDPLATNIAVTPSGYSAFLKQVYHSFLKCYRE